MIYRRSTLKFFEKKFGIIFGEPDLMIFEQASEKLSISLLSLVHDCARWLNVNFVTRLPDEFELDLEHGVRIQSNYCLQGFLGTQYVTFGVCPSKLRVDSFILAPGSALIGYLSKKMILKWDS